MQTGQANHLMWSRINVIHVQVYDILQHIQYANDADQVGIARLLGNRSFNNAFPMHDVSRCVITIYVYAF